MGGRASKRSLRPRNMLKWMARLKEDISVDKASYEKLAENQKQQQKQKQTMKNYTLYKPEGYKKKPLAGLKEWTAALRSGQYKQGHTFLCEKSRYCCLGVKCLIDNRPQEKMGGRVLFDRNSTLIGEENPLFSTLGEYGIFPKGAHVQIEFAKGTCNTLSALNDLDLTFLQIADVIEELWVDEKGEQQP